MVPLAPCLIRGVYGAALRTAENALFGPFALLIAAKSMLGALLVPLFGQFQKGRSRKFA
jgi:hypothetical protein